ncbi:glycosyltransferase [Jannaschia aquimarina]|uniref:Glycosyl transferase family 2 n=1 Tax=Jannaschia aquimarina TaxID=935700 RepID=A0A0D1ED11_9RHOB|nr:glycosyltransferase [Jannaschia aquimarina]KIT15614.1 Glycosyl transferase family 2 [Jannaschia aquimarina]SNT27739.1 Glycosyltransferase, GT2 family [Jannaschia aquimarina]
MIGRLSRIFRRYADAKLHLERTSNQAGDADQVVRVTLRENRLRVEGSSAAREVMLSLAGMQDVAFPGPDRTFALDLPWAPGDAMIAFDGRQSPLHHFDDAEVAKARQRLWLPYLADLVRLSPTILRWKSHGDMGAREIVKERLGLVPTSHAVLLDPTVLVPSPDASPFEHVTILMPVYGALALTLEALERVAANTDVSWHLILIDDASPDPDVFPALRTWAKGREQVTLIRNAENLGFVGTVNRGLAIARDRRDGVPVVLLNSDAMVPAGWMTRLLAPLADETVASVTPLSNDAEIFTVPVICAPAALPDGVADALDRSAADLSGPIEAPTGVGFCMALAPAFLRRVPEFDPAFGRGYGEETDWCQKTRAIGGRHVVTPSLFVEHRSGASFGAAAKARLLERNGAEISRRYPDYDDEVQTFLRDDPVTTARLALALDWAAVTVPEAVPVYLAHAMGGGAETWLRREIEADGVAVVLRVGQGHRFRLELHTPVGITQGLTDDIGLVAGLMSRLERRRIIYSCGVGDRSPRDIPDLLLRLAAQGDETEGAHPVEVLFHDYFPISPSYTLLDHRGVFRGVPVTGTPVAEDPAHCFKTRDGRLLGLSEWQSAWGRLLRSAEITVFSESSRRIVGTVWPDLKSRIQVRPHAVAPLPRIEVSGGRRPVIGVLGNIGRHKGADIVVELARRLAQKGAGLVVLGEFDPGLALPKPARCHGSYRPGDVAGLVSRYGITHWAIPSIWPETFSFTTHEALSTGMPVLAFALGAQGDAVETAPNGIALPFDGDPATDAQTLLAAVLAQGDAV